MIIKVFPPLLNLHPVNHKDIKYTLLECLEKSIGISTYFYKILTATESVLGKMITLALAKPNPNQINFLCYFANISSRFFP